MKLSKKLTESLTPQQLKAVELLAYNEDGKQYKDIAAEVGITPQTLIRWRANPSFAAAVNEISENLMECFVTDAYRALRKLAGSSKSDGSKLKALELILKNRGRLKDVQETTATITDDRSTEAILDEIDALKDRLGIEKTSESAR